MTLKIPELALVLLIGPSGSGKSSFAHKHFKATEVLSSDFCRGLVADDPNSQEATNDAFEVLNVIADKRLARGLLTVIDATNVQPESRAPLVTLAKHNDVLPVAIVLNLPPDVCHDRNARRPDRAFGPHVVRQQSQQLRRNLRNLQREGFRFVHVLSSVEEIDAATVERQPLWNNRQHDVGPFDIIGDVHGCYDELVELLTKLGYQISPGGTEESGSSLEAPHPACPRVVPPPGRKALFLGDLVDRGPASPAVLRLVMSMVAAGHALCVPGNHDVKLLKKLRGKEVQIAHGLAETLAQLAAEPSEFLKQVETFIDGLVGHYVLDGGRLVVAHAGMKQRYVGRASPRVRDFALYGETTGETDEFGLPVRHNWAAEYRGAASVVYGHTPIPQPDWLNRTLNVDTGCVFGGRLTALRWPEREVVSVAAKRTYAEPARPFLLNPEPSPLNPLSAQHQADDVLDITDVLGKRIVETRLHHSLTVREENAAAAIEVMSRFAADPRWLIYLPPTIAPTETSTLPGLLEHPLEAFDQYRRAGVARVVCEEKHMGSRAVVIVARDEGAVRERFGITGDGIGIIYTRTGRRFFDDGGVEAQLLARVHAALSAANFWDEFASDWFCLDCELMPWSAKAQDLLKNQYAAVGSAGRAALADVLPVLRQAGARCAAASVPSGGADILVCPENPPEVERSPDKPHVRLASPLADLLEDHAQRQLRVRQYVDAYRRYCWPVNSVDDLKLAPFHLLAAEGNVFVDRDHLWHMTTLARLAAVGGPVLTATAHRGVDLHDPAAVDAGVAWWESLTAAGGEGMVVKPFDFVVRGPKGLVQPAVKCRGREYLRIIYGPEYDAPRHLERLRRRGLGAKRSLALREFALGVEGLERFVRREPLRRVHECAFAVLALESEPVDPRL